MADAYLKKRLFLFKEESICLALFTHRHAIPPFMFRNVHGLISTCDQRLQIGGVGILSGHADANGYLNFAIRNFDGCCVNGNP
jgi:hypothetical protein